LWLGWLVAFLLTLQTLSTLLTKAYHLTLLRITKAQPVEPLIAAA
jgi:hypothetical protein